MASSKTSKFSTPASPAASSNSGGTLYLVFIQIASRGLTFVGNQFLLRYLSPSFLGLAVQLETLSVTVLYFARESLRVALQRRPATAVVASSRERHGKAKSPHVKTQEEVNLTYLVLAVGLCVSLGFGYGYLRKSNDEVLSSTDFWLAFRLYAAATFIELCTEPFFVVIQGHALFHLRARAETVAAISRCLAACSTTVLMHRQHSQASVLPFAVGQLFYAGALFITYLTAVSPLANSYGFSLLPRSVAADGPASEPSKYWLGMFSKPIISLTATFYAQSIFKLLLTQGDVLMLSFLADLKSQGAFALASNYGGLLSRLIFQPVEESSRNVFGRLLSSVGSSSSSSNKKPDSANSSDRTRKDPALTKSNLDLALTHLSTTLHIYTLCALPILTLIPPVFPPLSNLALPAQWRTPETTALLRAYLYYLPFLATNGILDAFVTSVATPRQLRAQSLVMAAVTVAYGAFAWALMAASPGAAGLRAAVTSDPDPWGSAALVYAGIFNMALRVAYSVWFVTRWTHDAAAPEDTGLAARTWRASVPRPRLLGAAAATAVALRALVNPDRTAGSALSRPVPGLPAISLGDVAALFTAAVVLGTSILVDEHQFLGDVVLPLLPSRVSGVVAAYLPQIRDGGVGGRKKDI